VPKLNRVLLPFATALALLGACVVFLSTARAAGTHALPAYHVTLTPNWVSPFDTASDNYNAVWLYTASPTTPYRSPDSFHHQGRYLLLDPRARDADGRVGNDDWWFVLARNWPSNYPADRHGSWGREVNFHNVAGDSGPEGGVGWSFGSGVSALALDWLPGVGRPQITIEPNTGHTNLLLPRATRDAWHTYVVHWVAGRTDGTTVRPGAIDVWADGSSKPAIHLRRINTVQRAKGPDGKWYVQKWMQLWDGDYTSNLQVPSTVRLGLTRIGRTLAQALADRPRVVGTSAKGQFYRGTGPNHGAPSAVRAGELEARTMKIPASLGTVPAATQAKPQAPARRPPVRSPRPTLRPATEAVSARPIRWDGKRFTRWSSFSAHLSHVGVDTNAFLLRRPTIARAFRLRPLSWDGQRFYTRRAFGHWLRIHHVAAGAWARQHPAAVARLRA
jgi:hypothetical protein